MWGDQASVSKYQTEFYYLNALITLQLFRKAVKHTQRKCSADLSPAEQRPARKQGWGSVHKCLQIELQKVSGEAPLLWASLLHPFIPFSYGGKNSAALKGRSSRCPHVASPVKKDKRSLQVSLRITLISFKPDNFPHLGAFLPFFWTLSSQWCTSCQGQKEVLAKRRLGIKANTDLHSRQCLSASTVRLYLPETMEEKNHIW